MMTKEEHDVVTENKVWLRGIHFTKGTFFPENLVAATPFKFLGFWQGFKMTLAKSDYPWGCSCSYADKAQCRAKQHNTERVAA